MAPDYRLSPEEPTGAGLRRIAGEHVANALALFDDPDVSFPEQVHEFRTTCKKLRALLHLAGTAGGEAETRIRDAARSVSAIRDRHVQAGLTPGESVDTSPPGDADQAAIRAAKARLHAGLVAMVLPTDGGRNLDSLQAGFDATQARCREALDRVAEHPSDSNHHHLRKWVKYHWYQLRLLADRVPGLEERTSAMKQIGEDLGQAQDLAVREVLLSEREAPDAEDLSELVHEKHALQKRSRKVCRHWFAKPVSV